MSMEFIELLERLKKYNNGNVNEFTVTSNKINGVSFLLIKDKEDKIKDCIILHDSRYDKRSVYTDLRTL